MKRSKAIQYAGWETPEIVANQNRRLT
jgi:hypothetical protein